MSGTKVASSGQPKLSVQDLSTLDVTTLTPLSPEVISRQATINIGTIGHVAHGKSTVVKAVSGVQTVRFKNELERNITIKLGNKITNLVGEKSQRCIDACKPGFKLLEEKYSMAQRSQEMNGKKLTTLTNGHVTNGHCNGIGHVGKRKRNSIDDVQPRKKNQNGRAKKKNVQDNDSLPASLPFEYEVERITAHMKVEDKIVSYKVKWVGYPDDQDTWEPVENVCQLLGKLGDYFQNMTYPGRGRIVFKSDVEILRKQLSVLNQQTIDAFCCKYLTETGHTIDINEDEVEEDLIDLSRIPEFARERKIVESIKRSLQLIEFKRLRTEQLALLKQWETDVNNVSTDPAPLIVVNGVDLDGPPSKFRWISKNVADFDVEIPDSNPLFCKCVGGCSKRECCWSQNCIGKPYTVHGLLRFARGTPVYECNKNCQCGPDCGNRILQKGRNVRVALFKTYNGIGWGARALEDIAEGQFVTEYVGEIIKSDVAELRGRTYDRHGCTYLFDLDFADGDSCPYTIDAGLYGNASHFINHSCNPNLAVWAVYVDCINLELPRLGLYATRKIKAGEELSFDYKSQNSSPVKKRDGKYLTVCKCNAKNCRKQVF